MAIILRHNVGRNTEALVLLMETAKERKADLVLVQEPPSFEGSSHQTFDFWRARRNNRIRLGSHWRRLG